MRSIKRRFSLWGRKRDAAKDCRHVLRRFSDWRSQQDKLAPPSSQGKEMLLIRLDDIGDYLLFRNQLEVYKQSTRWSGYKITLLGHEAWRDLFLELDAASVDDCIWVNKNRYLDSSNYRFGIWAQLRGRGFEVVIAPSCTRPLLLDDLCMLAAAPHRSLASSNSNVHASWNELSNALYTSLFKPSAVMMHEFNFNAEFAEWSAGLRFAGGRPQIALLPVAPPLNNYIMCFVGASTRSRRWPVNRWLQFVADYRRSSSSEIVFAGNSEAELEMVGIIQQSTDVESIAGTVTLPELLPWVAGARAVITNDTMAAHMGAILERPTVIIANGVNYMRFSEYRNLNFAHVATVYPDVFNRHRQRVGDGPYAYSDTVSADIASISAASVLRALNSVITMARALIERRGLDRIFGVRPSRHLDPYEHRRPYYRYRRVPTGNQMIKYPPPGSSHDPETSHDEEVREPPASDGKVIHEEFPRKGDIVDPGPAVGDK